MNTDNKTNHALNVFCEDNIWDSFTNSVKPFTKVTTFNYLFFINTIFRLFSGHSTTAKTLTVTVLATHVLTDVYNIGK